MHYLPLICLSAAVLIGLCWRCWIQYLKYGQSGFVIHHNQKGMSYLFFLVLSVIFGQAVAVTIVPNLFHIQTNVWYWVVGVLGMAAGIIMTAVSQVKMGASWRVGIDDAAPGLITTGPFSISRNPISFAVLVILAGYTLMLPTKLSYIVLIIAYFGLRRQIKEEESCLLALYGQEYATYTKKVGRLIPWVEKHL